MKSKTLAVLAAGLTLSAFTWISAAPAEAQVCSNSNYGQSRALKKHYRNHRKQLRQAYRNNSLPVNLNQNYIPAYQNLYRNVSNSSYIPFSQNLFGNVINPNYIPANQNLYGNVINPYNTNNNGLVRNLLNWF